MSMNAGAVTIVYDGDGNRVSETANGVTTQYLVDTLNPTGHAQVVDELVSGAVQRTYTYGHQRISENQLIESVWTPSFYGYDGAGSVRLLTNAAGTPTDTYEYDAFGNEVNHTGTTPNNYLYRGEQYDSNLGFYYLRARWYNPVTGRFLSRDPANGNPASPASLHKYLYTQADPVNLVDPSGRATVEIPKSLVILTLAAFTGLEVLKGGLNCAYNQEGTNTSATLYGGTYAQTAAIGPCTWVGFAGSGGGSGGSGSGGGSNTGGGGPGTPTGPGCGGINGCDPPTGPPTTPGCASNPQGCAGSNGGSLANAQNIAQPIINNYGNFQCTQCEAGLANAFSEAGYEGQFVEVNTQVYRYGGLTYDGQLVSTSGFHQAVVLDIGSEQYVFDQFANGVPLSEWQAGLDSGFPITYSFPPWPQ